MKKVNIFLPIEIKSRELDHSILLALACLKQNFRIYIGSKISINKIIEWKQDKNGIILYKSGLYKKDIKNYKKKINHFCILDQEIGIANIISNDHSDLFIKSRILKGTENLIDLYFVTNSFYKKKFFKNYPILRNKIKITGSPHYQLWDKKYKLIYHDRINELKRKYGKFTLFSSNFTFLNKKKIKEVYNYMKNDGWPHDQKFLNERLERSKIRYKEFKDFIKLLRFLDKRLKYKLIIRPHPSDPIDIWVNIAKNFNNIKIVYEGEVNKYILSSICHFHAGCSTAINSQLNSIPSFYALTNKKYYRESFITKNSFILRDKYKILNFLNNPSTQLMNDNVKKFNLENKNACKNIVNEFLKLNSIKSYNVRISLKDYFTTHLNLLIWRIKKILRIMLLQSYDNISINNKMHGGITIHEIKSTMKFLSSYSNKIKFKQVIPDCVEIDI